MISVFPSAATTFTTNGLKALKPRSAIVRKEDNGDYYIDLVDVIDNIDFYVAGNIVAIPTPWGRQAFRLSDPTITNKKITIRAWHVFFDTANYLIDDSRVIDNDANYALDHLNTATDRTSPFTTTSDVPAIASFECIRQSLQEAVGTIADRWGGHLVRDNFDIELRQTIGENRGVTIAYGKNIEEMKVKEDWSLVATKILPVGQNGLTVPETYLELEVDDYAIPYSKVVKFDQGSITQDQYKTVDGKDDVDAFQAALLADLYVQARAYLAVNHLPQVNYDLNAYLKDVSDVGDVIAVQHPKVRVNILTNVIALEYDAILEKISRVEFGNFKQNLQKLTQSITETVTAAAAKTVEDSNAVLSGQLTDATAAINAVMNDSYVLYDGNQILIVDTLPKEAAQNVIKINNGGIGFGQHGINGLFNSAWSIDGTMNMQNINVINLVADMIKGGTLKLGQNLNASGLIEIYGGDNSLSGRIDKDGIVLFLKTGESVHLNAIEGLAGYDSTGEKIYWADGNEFHQKKSVVEEEITIGNKLRILPINITGSTGVGFVAMVGS